MASRPVIADFYKDSVGAPGSIPTGGTTGQVLAKASNVDGDTTWSNAGSGDMVAANNLSDVVNAATARTNLGLAIGTNVQAFDADLSTWAGIIPGANVGTALAVAVGTDGAFVVKGGDAGTPSALVGTNISGTAASLTAGTASAVAVGGITGLGTNVATALAVNVGTDGAFITRGGNAGTPSAIVLTNASGTAASLTAGTASAVAIGGVTGLGTGVATALAINTGSAGAPVLFNGAGGTPSSITLTNATGTAASLTAGTASAVAVGGITGLGTGVAAALAVNVGTDGAFITRGGNAGTPSAIVLTNATGTAASLTAGTASAVAVGGITGLGTGVATALAINVGTAGAPVVLNGAGGTPSSLTLTNATGLPVSGLSSFVGLPVSLQIAASDTTTAITSGTAKVTFRMPFAMTLTAVRSSVTTAPTGSTLIVDINETGTSVLSTKLSIDASEKTSTTAASAAVISDSALADDAEITIDFDQVGSTIAGVGVVVTLTGTRA